MIQPGATAPAVLHAKTHPSADRGLPFYCVCDECVAERERDDARCPEIGTDLSSFAHCGAN